MVQEESGDSGFGLAVHDGAVYRGGATVFGQQGRVEIERALGRHGPYGFGQHTEGYNHEQVGLQRLKFLKKFGILQLLRLHHFQTVLHGIFLDIALNQSVTSAGYLVGHGHHGR